MMTNPYMVEGAEIQYTDFKKTFIGCDTFKLEKIIDPLLRFYLCVRCGEHNKRRVDKKLISHNGKGELLGLIETRDELEKLMQLYRP